MMQLGSPIIDVFTDCGECEALRRAVSAAGRGIFESRTRVRLPGGRAPCGAGTV
jgi:hypothetical protein